MAGRSPVYQILAGRERYTWEEGEGRIHQIIGVTYAAERWVRIESCQYWVVVLMSKSAVCACAPAASIIESDKIANFFIMIVDF